MKLLIIFSIICISNISIAQEHTDKIFPDSYIGKYKGELTIHSDNGQQNIPMEFYLLATDSVGKYDYTIIYGAGENKQTRSYTLKEKHASPGDYILDENNGIFLDARVVENRIYFLFEVMGSLLTTFITFEMDYMVFEIVASQTKKKSITGGLSEDIPEVISFPISVVQRARLQKVN